MELLEDEIRMIKFFRHMRMLPSEIVPFMSKAGKSCEYCPIREKCFSIFAHTRQGGFECQEMLKCWIEDLKPLLPVPKDVDKLLQSMGFTREKKAGAKCLYLMKVEDCHVSLDPFISFWSIRLTRKALDPEIYCEARDLRDLMVAFEKRIEKQIADATEFVEAKDLDVTFDDTMRVVDFARKAKSAFSILKEIFKKEGLAE